MNFLFKLLIMKSIRLNLGPRLTLLRSYKTVDPLLRIRDRNLRKSEECMKLSIGCLNLGETGTYCSQIQAVCYLDKNSVVGDLREPLPLIGADRRCPNHRPGGFPTLTKIHLRSSPKPCTAQLPLLVFNAKAYRTRSLAHSSE